MLATLLAKPRSPGNQCSRTGLDASKALAFPSAIAAFISPPEMPLEGQEGCCMPSLARDFRKQSPRGGVTLRMNQHNDVCWPAVLSSSPEERDGGPQARCRCIASPHPQIKHQRPSAARTKWS
jgi:hypothetical protein